MKSPSPVAFLLLLAVSLCAQVQAARVSGAIFTTIADGTVVNENHYASKCDVYLDGGPGPNAPKTAAGLPDGWHYFQVTDPSGKQLLSTDSVANRQFLVVEGVIDEYLGVGGGEPPHPTGVDLDHGATTISLANESCPADYVDTPNGGGVYKVWATLVSDFVGDPAQVDNDCGKGCFHGFIPSKSKTDNFKVAPSTATFCLTLGKELEDGSAVGGWRMTVTDPLGVEIPRTTGADGRAEEICMLTEGDYLVTEETNPPEHPGLFFRALFVNGVDRTNEIDPLILPFPTYSFTWTLGMQDIRIVFQNGGDDGGPPDQ